MKSALPARVESSVRVMIAKGFDPLSIRAVLNAVPEQTAYAKDAFTFASSMTPLEVDVCRDLFEDELNERRERAMMRRARFQAIEAAVNAPKIAKAEAIAPERSEADVPKRKSIAGLPLTTAIRFLTAEDCSAESIAAIIERETGEPVHPSTLQIQMRKAAKGEVPELSIEQAKVLRAMI